MGLGHERLNEDLTVWESDDRIGENNHRNFYRRWAQLMAARAGRRSRADAHAEERWKIVRGTPIGLGGLDLA
jgi:hypothetical protein